MPKATTKPQTIVESSALGDAKADLKRLSNLILRHAPYDGVFDLRLLGLHVTRVSRTRKELHHTIVEPALCLVAQGAKNILLGKDIFVYDASRMLVYSVDVPVGAQVLQASIEEPYLGLRLDIDPARIAELAPRVFPLGTPPEGASHAIVVDEIDPQVINAIVRLMEMVSEPGQSELLAPLVIDEILIRLLHSRLGPRVALLGQEKSRVHRVSQAVAWVRANYNKPLDVERLARMVHMSPSSFHQHFKAITSLSPLQYQKAIRLQEARRLMLLLRMDAGPAGRQVGYFSSSQFTREYGRYFGSSPTRDIAQIRQTADTELSRLSEA